MTVYDREKYIRTDSTLKRDLLKLFRKDENIVVFDVGGCEGEESLRYSRIFPLAKIFVFEPLPENQILIEENLRKYNAKNIELIPAAVSDLEGDAQFYISEGHPENQPTDLDWNFGNKSSSLLYPNKENNPKWLKFESSIDVKTTTLSTFIEQRAINEVDFIHMDVQGAELKVLNGAKKYISKIKVIWLEVASIELYNNQPLIDDIESFMDHHDFYLFKSEINGNVGDQLYINKKYFKSFSILKRKIVIKQKNNT